MLFAVLFSTFLTFSFASPTDNRIVGGHPVDITDYGFVGSLRLLNEFGNDTRSFCGCTILSERVIGTAAHCVEGRPARSIRLRFNSSYHAEGGVLVEPKEIFIHELYNASTFDYDIAVLILSEPLQLSIYPSMRKISLPYQNQIIEDGEWTRVCGWGVTQSPDEPRDRLRCVDVPIVNQVQCNNAFRTRTVTDRMICAGDTVNGGIDACQGDSGGPLLSPKDGTLVGLVSWGILCASRLYPGVYVRVPYFRDWIDAHIKKHSQRDFEIIREKQKFPYQF